MIGIALAAWTLAVCGLLALPGGAWSHSSLRSSTPAADAVVEDAPSMVELRFSESVTPGPDAVTVYAPDGATVQTGAAQSEADGTLLRQSLETTQRGTHAVAFRVTSGDGHTIAGSVTFHVGERGQGNKAAELGRAQARVSPAMFTAFGVSRFFVVMALLGAVGSALFGLLLAPRWRVRWLGRLLVLLVLALAVSVVLDGAIVRGTGIGSALEGEGLRASIQNPFGSAALVTGALAILALVPAGLLRSGAASMGTVSRAALVLVFVGLTASMSLAGHAAVDEPVAIRLPLDVLHVLAAAVWLGGLLQLGALAPQAHEHLDAIKRFSKVAFGCVLTLLATGIYATVSELGLDPRELVETQYGRIILAKLVLYAGTMPLAWLNMTLYVPTLARRPDRATGLLRQYVGRELFLLLVVVGLTAWLIGSDPSA